MWRRHNFFRFSPKVPKVKFVPGRKRFGADLRCPGLLATSGDAMCGRHDVPISLHGEVFDEFDDSGLAHSMRGAKSPGSWP